MRLILTNSPFECQVAEGGYFQATLTDLSPPMDSWLEMAQNDSFGQYRLPL